MIEGKRTKNNLIGRKANMMLCLGSDVSRFDEFFFCAALQKKLSNMGNADTSMIFEMTLK